MESEYNSQEIILGVIANTVRELERKDHVGVQDAFRATLRRFLESALVQDNNKNSDQIAVRGLHAHLDHLIMEKRPEPLTWDELNRLNS